MWMTLLGVKILKMRKSMRVILRNTMMRVEAPLLMPPVTAFTSAAMVGTGRGVGVVGGGTGRSSLQKKVTWNMCQQYQFKVVEDDKAYFLVALSYAAAVVRLHHSSHLTLALYHLVLLCATGGDALGKLGTL